MHPAWLKLSAFAGIKTQLGKLAHSDATTIRVPNRFCYVQFDLACKRGVEVSQAQAFGLMIDNCCVGGGHGSARNGGLYVGIVQIDASFGKITWPAAAIHQADQQ